MTPTSSPSTLLEAFRYHTPMLIRYGDMDTLGHVNNAKYLTYIEHSRVSYFNDLGLWDGEQSRLGAIVARISIDYKLPLTVTDGTVDIWTRCSRLGSKSFDLESLIITHRGDTLQIAAQSTAVIVVFDYEQNVSAVMPDAWRAKIIAYEPALLGTSPSNG